MRRFPITHTTSANTKYAMSKTPDQHMPKLWQFVSSLLGQGSKEILGQQERRDNVLTIAPIGFAVAVIFSLFNTLLAPFPVLGMIEAGGALLLLLPAIRLARRGQHLRWAENLLMLCGFLLFGALVVIGGVGGTGLFWAYSFPFMAFFIKGQRKGWLWSGLFLLEVGVLLLALRGTPLAYPYDPVQIPHYLSSLLFVSVIAACFNLLRSRFQEKLHEGVLANTATAQHYLDQLQFLALHDPVTKLPNRTRILPVLQDEIGQAQSRHGGLLVIAMRLSRLPEISNIIGSDATNELMQAITGTLQQLLGEGGILARIAREELLVIFHMRKPQFDLEKTTQMVGSYNLDFEIRGFPVHIDYTAGIAVYPRHGANAEDLLHKAEQSMLQALQHGQSATMYDASQDEAFVRYHYRFGRLRDAMAQNQLTQHFQPLINIRTGKLVAAEALARWFDPEEGFISPLEFIPIAESSGLIKPLTRWTIREALHQCALWQTDFPGVAVSVNLSVRSLFDTELLPMLRQLLQETGINPALVRLEVTESLMLTSPEKGMAILHEIVALGVRLAIDDYGTGFSSLGYLKHLPVQELKIDQRFINKLVDDRGNMAIVESTIDLAHHLGLMVVAEGIEDQETMQQLWLLGCDIGQGYYYSKPMPIDDYLSWCHHYQRRLQTDTLLLDSEPDNNALL
jgi:diguanylate cyclase (GGDEF)-like protein